MSLFYIFIRISTKGSSWNTWRLYSPTKYHRNKNLITERIVNLVFPILGFGESGIATITSSGLDEVISLSWTLSSEIDVHLK